MKVFESLNCCLCRSPFVAIANQPRSPRHLGCGKAMCHECFEAEKALRKTERKHQCTHKHCFSNPNFAYPLIEVLSSGALFPLAPGTGYLLAEKFISPECPVCHEEFTNDEKKHPYFLKCLHDLCMQCLTKCRQTNEGAEREKLRYCIVCPQCKAPTLTNYPYPDEEHFLVCLLGTTIRPKSRLLCAGCHRLILTDVIFDCTKCKGKFCEYCAEKNKQTQLTRNPYSTGIPCSHCNANWVAMSRDDRLDKQLLMFLEELPKMTHQLDEMNNSPFRFCDDCKCLDSIERMFDCTRGNKKICGTCAFQNHRGRNHKVSQLLEKEALDLSTTMEEASMNEVAAYRDIFPEFHSKISNHLKDFQEKLASKAKMLRNKRTFEALQKSHNNCKRLKINFESLCEEYMPSLRKCDTQLEGLIQELDKEPD